MHLRTLSVLVLATGTAFCTVAIAQAPNPTQPSTGTGATPGGIPPSTTIPGTVDFGGIDADGDGFISRAEASRAGVAGQFTKLDKNNDGRLDRAEFSAHRGDPARTPGLQSGTSSSSTGTGTTTR